MTDGTGAAEGVDGHAIGRSALTRSRGDASETAERDEGGRSQQHRQARWFGDGAWGGCAAAVRSAEVGEQDGVVAGVDGAVAVAVGGEIGCRAERVAPDGVVGGIDPAVAVEVAGQWGDDQCDLRALEAIGLIFECVEGATEGRAGNDRRMCGVSVGGCFVGKGIRRLNAARVPGYTRTPAAAVGDVA
jgi:hypothetical protein